MKTFAEYAAACHVELIDLNRFSGLWQEFYDNLSDEDKILLPLRPIYFLGLKQWF
jgi:restriction system protein